MGSQIDNDPVLRSLGFLESYVKDFKSLVALKFSRIVPKITFLLYVVMTDSSGSLCLCCTKSLLIPVAANISVFIQLLCSDPERPGSHLIRLSQE